MELQKRTPTHARKKTKARTTRPRSQKLHNPTDPARSAEQQYWQQQVAKYGKAEAERRLAVKSGYTGAVPTIDTFLHDPYYFQPFLGVTADGTSKWRPYWVDALRHIYPSPYQSPFLEVVLTGCIGAGKSTCGLAGMAYDLCHLLHMQSPQNFYGDIGDSTRIVFALFNTTKTRAESVLYDQLITAFSQSPFFREQLAQAGKTTNDLIAKRKDPPRRQRGLLNEKSAPIFPNRLDLAICSRANHVLGDAVAGAMLCELNFQTVIAQQAYDNYNQTRRRLISRFTNAASYPGRLWMDSSRAEEMAFLEAHIDMIKSEPSTAIFSPALWEVKPDSYSGETFPVFAGNSKRDPMIITEADQLQGVDEADVIQVPVEHKIDFARDINAAIAELAGRTMRSEIKLIPSVEAIEATLTRPSPLLSDKEVVTVDFFDKSQQLLDEFDIPVLQRERQPRFIHVDLGLRRDRAGIASTYIAGAVNQQKFNPLTGLTDVTRDPVYVTEWVLYLQPKPGEDIPIYKIKKLIIDLRDVVQLIIHHVTTDGYQSENLRQDLTLVGIDTALQSVDKTRAPYDLVKDAILEGRWSGPDHGLLRQEWKDLLDQGKKIDHPMTVHDPNGTSYRGSKDGTDAVAGSVFTAHQHMNEVMQINTIQEVLMAQAGHPSAATAQQEAWGQLPQLQGSALYDAIKRRQDPFFGASRLPQMPDHLRR